VVNYDSVCVESTWEQEMGKIAFYVGFDAKECETGFLAIFFAGDIEKCKWRNNRIDWPIYQYQIPNFYSKQNGDIFTQVCL